MRLELLEAEERLVLLDLQAARFEDGLVLKRGFSRLFLEAPGIEEMVEALVDAARREGGATRSELLQAVSTDGREMMESLVDALLTRRFLVPSNSAGDRLSTDVHERVFYWSYGTSADSVRTALGLRRIAVIGVNHVGNALAQALVRSGLGEVTLVDHPKFANLSLDAAASGAVAFEDWAEADDLPDCLVVTADFGGPALMAEWNVFCVENDINFYPVLLHDHMGLLGPLVLPGESACYECADRRERSVSADFDLRRATDAEAYYAQHSVGFLQPMATAVASLAATELVKFYSQALPGRTVGQFLELNLLEPSITNHRILKVPRCPVCSTLRRQPTTAANAAVFMPGND